MVVAKTKKASNLKMGASGGQNLSEDWTRFGKKQILSIGSKRQRTQDEDDEIADEALGGRYDSSSDEEEGRTSAVKDKKRKVRPVLATPAATSGANRDASADIVVESAPSKKKKKKRGKKERAKEKVEEVNPHAGTADGSTSVKEENDIDKSNGITLNKENHKKDNGIEKSNNTTINKEDHKKDNTNPNTKRKRRKVRSRQKNIRKDNRSASDKPSHLVLGRSEYSGRPMTKETKKKLGLEHEMTSEKNAASPENDAFDSGEWVGGDKSANVTEAGENGKGQDAGESLSEGTKPKSGPDGGDVLMKIGDCIVDSDIGKPGVSGQDVGGDIVSKKKDKKKQKRKFKNLVG